MLKRTLRIGISVASVMLAMLVTPHPAVANEAQHEGVFTRSIRLDPSAVIDMRPALHIIVRITREN